MIKVKTSGDFKNLRGFLNKQHNVMSLLNEYGRKGVTALSKNTPVDSGKTASSWRYEIKKTSKGYEMSWLNDNNVNGVSIAVILDYGHATRNGGYVGGYNYINPAIEPIINELSEKIWLEVIR